MNTSCRRHKRPRRRAAILVLAVLMISLMVGMVAFAVDIGYIVLIRTQLQVASDSGAMAGAAQLIESSRGAVATAQSFANRHVAGSQSVALQAADVEFGRWSFLTRTFDPAGGIANAVRVTTRRDSQSGGEAPLFFARVFGFNSCAARAEATAGFVDNFRGFRAPPGENAPFLPLAIDKPTCDAMLAGAGADDWSWDPASKAFTFGSDGVAEANLFPHSTGARGNLGTVDIGPGSNSTADLARQILNGVTAEDLSYHGGSLSLDGSGQLQLAGDPGLSAGIKDELAAIAGEPRIIPVYDQVSGQGASAQFRIVQFVGVRILDVELTGSLALKRVIIQPADVIVRGGIPYDGPGFRSRSIYSRPCLVQ